MGGRSRRLRNKARREGKPEAKGRAMIELGVADAPVKPLKKKKAAKKK